MLDVFRDISKPDLFFLRLQAETGVTLKERKSAIIFDEIQLQPKVRQAIKYLVQDGRYDYIDQFAEKYSKKVYRRILFSQKDVDHVGTIAFIADGLDFVQRIRRNLELLSGAVNFRLAVQHHANAALFNIADGHMGGMRMRRVRLAPFLVTHAFNPIILFAVRNLAHFLPSKATAN